MPIKYSALVMLKAAPEFRETGQKSVEVSLPASFFETCETLNIANQTPDEVAERASLNQLMFEKAQKKHKNFLRRQRAKHAKKAIKENQKEQEKESQVEVHAEKKISVDLDVQSVESLSTADSGVSEPVATKKSGGQAKKNAKPVQKSQKPTSFQMKNNFANQGKLRAAGSDDESIVGKDVFLGESSLPSSNSGDQHQPRTWANSRLRNRAPRARIGSRS